MPRIPLRRLYKFDEQGLKVINEFIKDVATSLDSQLDFGDGTNPENLYVSWVTVEFGAAGTEASASHTLNRTPVGVIPVWKDRAGDVYISSAATSADIYLKSDTDTLSAKLIIF